MSETNNHKFHRRTAATLGVAIIGAGLAGAGVEHTPSHNQAEQKTTQETPADSYKQESLSFVQAAIDKLANSQVETNGQGSENVVYTISNIPTSELVVLKPGEDRKRIVANLNLHEHSSTLEVVGVEESSEGMQNRIATTFELDEDNPIYDTNPDAPLTAQDFITAINGVGVDDVRSIIVFGQGVKGELDGEFTPDGSVKYTDGKNPITELPSREQIHAVAEAVAE